MLISPLGYLVHGTGKELHEDAGRLRLLAAMTEKSGGYILGVGFGSAPAAGLPWVTPENMMFLPFAALTGAVLAEYDPAEIVTPLIGQGCDATLVAQTLVSLEFHGTLRVVCPQLPRTAMIWRELSALAKGMRVVLILPAAPDGMAH